MSEKIIKYPGKKFRELFDEEIEKYKNALKDDPEDALSQVGLAESYINSWCYGFLSRDDSSFCTGGCYRIEGGLLSALFS